MTSAEDWARSRSAAAAEHLARLEARRNQEHLKARELLTRFVGAARRSGLAPTRLYVRGPTGSRRARTPLSGWYLRRDERAGIDLNGNFYVLTAPLTLADVIRGVTPAPDLPPLVLGAGGRDGDSVELRAALERILPGWDSVAG